MESLVLVTKMIMSILTGMACGSLISFLCDIKWKNVYKVVPCFGFYIFLICFYKICKMNPDVAFLQDIMKTSWYDIVVTCTVTITWFFLETKIKMSSLHTNSGEKEE